VRKSEIFHLTLLVVWLVMIPVAVLTGWLWAIGFVSACSLYANAAAHAAAFEAAHGERKQKQRGQR
jgi:hypothetical protein